MSTEYDLPAIRQRLERELPRTLYAHCMRVRDEALKLAQRYGLDPTLAEVAALVHDAARHLPGAELLGRAKQYSIPVSPLEERMPLLIHGPVGAEVLRRDWSITDSELLAAVSCHTTGREQMTLLDKVLFLADKLEPAKSARYPFNGQVRRKAQENLDGALLDWLSGEVRRLVDIGAAVHPQMVAARNSLLLAGRKPAEET
ncbi:MAG: bis(5'-nucleosyl)-tetraphosphatase (symmetrical) YqeK [Chloroflexi bacterium]|nr:bis(5'-nucleosyl)-tetraphosphatase (symmetrical) YqeK [Chloroflexota bacterium]